MSEPRRIFLDACLQVARALEPDGFRWRKSKTDLVKNDGDLSFEVRFQSSSRNALLGKTTRAMSRDRESSPDGVFLKLKRQLEEIVGFGRVTFMAHVGVHDRRLKEWREKSIHSIGTGGAIAETNIGYLAAEKQWLEVNLANPRARESRTDAIIELIRSVGFAYFEEFRHPERIVDAIVEAPFEGMWEVGEVEYAVVHRGVDAGRKVIQRCFRQWPTCEEEYRSALREYRQSGIPEVWESKAGPRLAKAALALGIEG